MTVVVLNWNQPRMTGRCLDHVLAQTGVRPVVLVVDNGSTLANRKELEAVTAGRCRVLWLPRNDGFAGGMNAGVRHAAGTGADYVWLLNNDAFPAPDCLSRLVAAMRADGRLGCVTPRLLRADGSEQHAGARMSVHPFRVELLSAAELDRPVSAGHWLTGTALLVRADLLRAAPPFDRRFFAYWEDVDFHLRLAAAGHHFRAVPAADCRHIERASAGGGDSPFNTHIVARNVCLLQLKHLTPARGLAACAGSLAGHLRNAGLMTRAAPELARALVGAAWAVCTRRYGRPGSLYAPGWAERLVLRRPFHVAHWVGVAGTRLDRLADRFARRPGGPGRVPLPAAGA